MWSRIALIASDGVVRRYILIVSLNTEHAPPGGPVARFRWLLVGCEGATGLPSFVAGSSDHVPQIERQAA